MRYTVYSDNNLLLDTQNENFQLFNPKLDLELNKTGSFSFKIYPNHPSYDKLQRLKSIITVYSDDDLIFRGRILNDEQGFHNEKQVTCEGELAFLLDSIQRPYQFPVVGEESTVEDLFTFFITNHNSQVDEAHRFIVGNITVTDPNDYVARSDTTYLNTWDSINQKLINSYGGYLRVRHEEDGNYIDYLSDFSEVSSQKIEFGKNLLDIKRTTKGEDIATAIIPLGAKDETTEERLTIASVNDGVDYVYNQSAVDQYGWIFKSVFWDDVTIPANLLRKANEYLANAMLSEISIDLTAADLSKAGYNISAFRFGVYIPVSSAHHNLNANFLVNKLSINLLDPKSNKLTLGTTYKTFTEQTQNLNNNIQNLGVQITTETKKRVDAAVVEVREQNDSAIQQSSEQIISSVRESFYLKDETDSLVGSVETKLTQTKDAFELQFNQMSKDIDDVQSGTNAEFTELRKYIRFVDGNIVLGEEGNELILKIQNDRISFMQSNVEVAYFSNRKLYVLDGEFIHSLRVGSYAFIPRDNGNLSFKI